MYLSVASHLAGPADVLLQRREQGLFAVFTNLDSPDPEPAQRAANLLEQYSANDAAAAATSVHQHLYLDLAPTPERQGVAAAIVNVLEQREWFVRLSAVALGSSRLYRCRLSGHMEQLPPYLPIYRRPKPLGLGATSTNIPLYSRTFQILAGESLILTSPTRKHGLGRSAIKALVSGADTAAEMVATLVERNSLAPPPSLITLAN